MLFSFFFYTGEEGDCEALLASLLWYEHMDWLSTWLTGILGFHQNYAQRGKRITSWSEHWAPLHADEQRKMDCPTVQMLAHMDFVCSHGRVRDKTLHRLVLSRIVNLGSWTGSLECSFACTCGEERAASLFGLQHGYICGSRGELGSSRKAQMWFQLEGVSSRWEGGL
jgi:hypothetical protein